MSEEDSVDIEQELDDLLTQVQPNLQDVIKRVNIYLFLLCNINNSDPQVVLIAYFYESKSSLCITMQYVNIFSQNFRMFMYEKSK